MNAKRIVVKIGSGVLAATDKTGVDDEIIAGIAGQVSSLRRSGLEPILVSSGSVAAGTQALELDAIPVDISRKQAAAAVGQSHLIGKYERAFKKEGDTVAQILLTHGDLSDRRRYLNARTTLLMLIEAGVIPVINENDTVAVDELKFGDNDHLASLVALMVEADLLVILSDVKGLYSADPKRDPKARIIPVVHSIDREIEKAAGFSSSIWGSGGMRTKIQAAQRCMSAGIAAMIVFGREPDILLKAVSGEQPGTLFHPAKDGRSARERWIAHTLKVKGSVIVDKGAKEAILTGKKSLLPAGIIEVSGDFYRGDAVRCMNGKDHEFARGLVNYGSRDIEKIKGIHSAKIEEYLGFRMGDEVIHRDNMVIMG